MSRLTRAIRLVRHWHARMGVLVAVFLLLLSITGLALSHTEALRLDRREISASWLMHWYGLKSTVPKQGYLFEDGYLAAENGRWVMNGKVLNEPADTPVGAVGWGGMRGLASADVLYLYMADGRLVDKLTGSVLPAQPIKRLGIAGEKLAVDTAKGVFLTSDGLGWEPMLRGQPKWSVVQPLPDIAQLREAFAPSLSLERILLDLHSGRILGRHGPLLMDIAAMVLIILALSGLWIYLRTWRRGH